MKDSIQKYGWIVITVIIIAILIGLAFPAVHYLKDSAVGAVIGIGNKMPSIGGGSGSGGSGGSGSGEEIVEAGLYQTGSNYTVLLKPWNELLNEGVVHVEDGVVYTNFNGSKNASSDALAGDLMLPSDGSITQIGCCTWSDESMGYVGNTAFNSCTALTGIVIPNSVTNISDQAFFGCSSLMSIEIPDSVINVGTNAFTKCSSLNYNVYDNALYLGNEKNPYVILIETSTKDILSCEINENTKCIYSNAFYGCTELKNIIIPNDISCIGRHAFDGCTQLTDINIPNKVISINIGTFRECTALTNITFGEKSKVTFIDNFAFENCKKLVNITIPSGVTNIGQYAFNNCSSLTSVTFGENSCLTNIEDNVFANCSNLTYVTIPDSVTKIEYRAFYGCSSLTNISFSDNLSSIGHGVFEGCTSLEQVVFAKNCPLTNISYDAFDGCSQLVTIELPNKITTIGSGAFQDCISLKNIEVPSGVTNIYDYAFSNCTSLTTVTFGENSQLASIGNRAFYECTSLVNIEIPDSVTSIGQWAFYNCTNLTNIKIPSSITSIESYVFEGCTNLKTVYYEGTLEQWCLINFKSASSNPCFKGAQLYINNELVTDIIIPSTIVQLNNYVFYNYANLNSVVLSNGVTKIGDYAFNGCTNLASVNIPNGVTSIGRCAFYNCENLTSITYEGTTAEWQAISFGSKWNYNVPCDYIICSDGKVCAGSHTGGTATCQQKAVCVNCGNEYGNLSSHTGGTATCQQKAVCVNCGNEYGNLSSHTGGTATCEQKAVCINCGLEYGDFDLCNIVNGNCILCGKSGTVIESEHSPYANNQNYVVLGTWDYSDANSVTITITYQTQSSSYDWCSITSGTDYVNGSSSSYKETRTYLNTSGNIVTTTGSYSSVKFGGTTQKTVTFTNVDMLTGSVIFKSNSTKNDYYGVTVTVVPNY